MSAFGSKGKKAKVATAQSTKGLLGDGGVFLANEFQEILNSADVSVSVFSDVDSAIDGLKLEWSNDGVNIDSVDEYTIKGGQGEQYTFGSLCRFVRVRYINGSDPQTTFRLQTIVSPTRRKPSSHRLGDELTREQDAELVKAVLAGEDEFQVIRNILATRFGRSTNALHDSQTDSPLLITPSGQLNTGELVRLVGGNFVGGQPLLDHIWTTNTVGGGNVTTVDGELNLNTNGGANGAVRLTTFRRARFITATFNLAHLAVSTPGNQNADVLRRWGVFDPTTDSLGQDGIFFENNSGTYAIVRVKNGAEADRLTLLIDGDGNQSGFNSPNPLIINDNVAVYEIFYNAGTIFFFQNRKLIHRMSSLDSAAYNSPHLRAGAAIENINGNTASNVLVSRGFAISRIGANSAIPEPFHITSSGTFVIKNTPARLHKIIINDKGQGMAIINVFNNFAASGEIVASIDTTDVVGDLEFQIELDIGLTITTEGGAVDVTVVFD